MKLPPGHKTALNRARYLGAAHGGTHHFLLQRLTALSNIPLVIAFILISARGFFAPYDEARALFASPWVAIAFGLFILSVSLHMRLGMQVIIEDYVHTKLRKFALLALNTFYATGIAVICLFALLRVNFGL